MKRRVKDDSTAIKELAARVAASAERPWTEEDQAWFDALPELPPLPTEPGQTVAIMFTRKRPARRGGRRRG